MNNVLLIKMIALLIILLLRVVQREHVTMLPLLQQPFSKQIMIAININKVV